MKRGEGWEAPFDDPTWAPFVAAADNCPATHLELRRAVERYGLTLEHATRLANHGALPTR